MVTKDNIKQHTTLVVLFSILTYSVLIFSSTLLLENNFLLIQKYSNFSISGIYNTISIISSVFIAIILLEWKLLVKFILGDQFIAGKYIGTSKPPTNEDLEIHNETIIIKQTLINTSISGQSYKSENNFTTWEGILFKIENNSFLFALSINTEPHEYGILSIQFFDESFHGIYYSSNPVNHKTFIIKGKKVKLKQ